MAKLSKKSAVRIASLFNSIAVSELMRRNALRDAEAGKIDSAEHLRLVTLWRDAGDRAAADLRNEFGISPIGV